MSLRIAVIAFLSLLAAPAGVVAASFDLGTATLTLDDDGTPGLTFADGTVWTAGGPSAFSIQEEGRVVAARSVHRDGDRLIVTFESGTTAEFSVAVQHGFAVFRLTNLSAKGTIERLRLFRLGLPPNAQRRPVLNAATHGPHFAAVLAGEPNVHAFLETSRSPRSDREGGRHEFVPSSEARAGRTAAKFTATSNSEPGGWSMRGRSFDAPLDLTGLRAIRAWVHGDGQGQALKFQLSDGRGGNRDTYLPIDFEGWRHVTLTEHPYDNLRYDHVTGLNFYYNGLPADRTVSCLIDKVEAIVERDGREQAIVLEDFEASDSPLWDETRSALCVETLSEYGIEPAAFAVLACPESEFLDVMPKLEVAAGLPSPRPGGVWNKRSPWVDRSYLFLTRFNESQIEEALDLARRGGFAMILLGQSSWADGTGHYAINRRNFPDGIDSLKRTVQRFHDEGFHVGLHFLGPSIYPPDPYLTPVPDPRLVKGATATLAGDVAADASTLPLEAAPTDFPAEDGGYRGDGAVLQIGDELIRYESLSTSPPFAFQNCRRGYLGTKATPHAKGAPIRHLKRSYGYHMYDMDTTLLDEVSQNFAAVADACEIDMIYFDGSERLQGDHWYYNARLHKAFYDQLANKDTLLQASSFSHYSWHLLARSASADGHGDLKGYLEERAPAFAHFERNGMPLDIGWYYGYDPESTLDQYEYVLGATIGYDSSMSFQVSVDAASEHPFTDDILNLISRYEQLRLSGRVPSEMRERLRIDPALVGSKVDDPNRPIAQRRDYRLLDEAGKDVFQRVIYAPWQELTSDEPEATWTLDVPDQARAGFQVHLRTGPWLAAGPSYEADDAVVLETFDDLAPFTGDPENRGVQVIEAGQAGSVSPGVTQRMELRPGGKEGTHYAAYTAESTLDTAAGWSVLRRSYESPLDLSGHAGIGLWLLGDGHGGKFKLQLSDGKAAMDYYIENDYEGWRYHQLERPETDTIDYRQVRSLLVYYNGLPGKTTVTCGIDGVKAIARLDRQTISDPWIEIGPHRLTATATLGEGQYLFAWPDEPIRVYGTPRQAPISTTSESIKLEPGAYPVRFGYTGGPAASLRVRTTLQTSERHVLP